MLPTQAFTNVIKSMMTTDQTKGMTILEHGELVYINFNFLVNILEGEIQGELWSVPDCIKKNAKDILANLHSKRDIESYLIMHDCGKPLVRTVDDSGNVHFPGHAEASKKLFFSLTGNRIVSNLMGWDMVLHSGSAEEIDHLLKNEWTKKDACTLMLSAISEVHSNARMFGGPTTDSFKSKYNKISRRCRQICRYLYNQYE